MKVTNRVWVLTIAPIMAVGLITAAYGQNKAAKAGAAAGKYPTVVMDTSMGTIKIELYTDKAPVTAKNFIAYVNAGFYNNTTFHRVVPGFVIQGGGYLETMVAKPTRAGIQNESKNGLKNLRGTLSMARYTDPNSATSQFFINLANNPHLDPPGGGWGYAVFAKVVEGMDVVDKIAKVKTATRSVQGTPFENVPVEPITIKAAKLIP
jgi:peptidyl-prolyl cis-trans isomerase A (cyclophilin A)